MLHPATELRFISDEVGFGVFAREHIPRGTITWAFDPLDQQFTPTQLDQLPPMSRAAVDRYSYINADGTFVLCWDHARFMNHSCNPTCLSAGFSFEFAIRDIAKGEQITDDYGLMNLQSPMSCSCGSTNCRRIIQPEDSKTLTPDWDALVLKAFPFISKVHQPLWSILEENERSQLEAALAGQMPIPSCAAHQPQQA